MKNVAPSLLVLATALFADVFIGSELAGEKAAAQVTVKMPEVIVLAKDNKLGTVTFNHVSHNGGKYSIDGTGPIACIECHHAARPVSDVIKHPPLKTAWPAERTTTLTSELFTKDPAAAGVAACRDCHARAGEVPKLLPALPEIKHESSTAMITLTNQQAYHRNCAGCHTEAKKVKPAMKGPTTMQCTVCHKKSA
ncbi:MAG: cytochrome c3 family protein [Acidobacteriota bacterium]